MIYCALRFNETYRIHTTTSDDGTSWKRSDESLLTTGQSGWDSEMVCSGTLLQHGDLSYLLYNGNAYGREGFGVARMQGGLVG